MILCHLKKSVTIFLITGLTACVTSSTLTNRWHDPQYSGAPFKKFFVIALVQKETSRRALEDSYIERLKRHGATGIASYTLISDPEKAYEENQLKTIVTSTNADAVLFSRLQGINKERTEVPPRVEMVPTTHYRGYYGYYNTTHQAVYQPGYTRVDKVVMLETKVFAVDEEKMVWAGNTKSFNPKTARKVIKEITRLIIDDIKASGLVGR